MIAHSVAGALDLYDDGVVQQSVEQRGGHYGVAEDLSPFGKAAIRGEDHGAFFIASVDQLEEQIGPALGDRQVADLIDDKQCGTGVEADFLGQSSFAFSLDHGIDQFGESGSVDAFAGLDRSHPERAGDMTLAGSGRAEQVHRLGPLDELQLRQGHDPVAIERRLEGKVEAFQGLDRNQPRGVQGDSHPSILTRGVFLDQQRVDGFDNSDFPLFQAAQGLIEDLQCSWHAQGD